MCIRDRPICNPQMFQPPIATAVVTCLCSSLKTWWLILPTEYTHQSVTPVTLCVMIVDVLIGVYTLTTQTLYFIYKITEINISGFHYSFTINKQKITRLPAHGSKVEFKPRGVTAKTVRCTNSQLLSPWTVQLRKIFFLRVTYYFLNLIPFFWLLS